MVNIIVKLCRIEYNNYFYSPFKLKVRPKFELDKIKIEGPGVSDSRGVKASVPTYFVVDATDAGSGKLDLRIMVSMKCKKTLAELSYESYQLITAYKSYRDRTAIRDRWKSKKTNRICIK
jgi:hypothetical protein